MGLFSELENNSRFSIKVGNLHPVFEEEDIILSILYYVDKVREKSYVFEKTNDVTCKEVFSGTEFEYSDGELVGKDCDFYFSENAIDKEEIEDIYRMDENGASMFFRRAIEVKEEKNTLTKTL